jgi:hypothetical protein
MGWRGALARKRSIRDETIMAKHREHLTTTEARAGSTPHVARYVLVIGTGLVIMVFAIILFAAG